MGNVWWKRFPILSGNGLLRKPIEGEEIYMLRRLNFTMVAIAM